MADESAVAQSRIRAQRRAAIPAEIVQQTQPVLIACADGLAGVAMAFAPKDMGDLAESIDVTPTGGPDLAS